MIINLKTKKMEQEINPQERPVIQYFIYYGNIGQNIVHVDRIEAGFDKNMGITVDGQGIMPAASASPDDEALVPVLAPCFYGIESEAREFLGLARKLKDRQITELVNAWLVQKRISPMSCKRNLWAPLHEHGIYGCGESCWDGQVRIPGM